MKEVLNEVISQAEELSTATSELIAKMKDIPLDALNWPPLVPFIELVSRVFNLSSLSKELARITPDRFVLAPSSRVVSLRDQLAGLLQSIRALSDNMGSIPSWGGVSQFDPATGLLHMVNGHNVNLGALIGELQSRYDSSLEPYLVVASAVQPRNIGTFGAASKTVVEKAAEVGKLSDNLEQIIAQWKDFRQKAETEQATLTGLESESQRILAEVEKARRTVEENAAKVGVAVSSVEEIRAQASALESVVSGYQATFDAFQKQLEGRKKDIDSGRQALGHLTTNLATKEKQIDALVKKAEEMLGGATTAGLATAYKSQADGVNDQLGNARAWYYGSIVMLAVSVAAALNLFNSWGIALPPLPTFSDSTPTGNIAVQALSSLGSRALLILPALLLAGFTAHRHSALFRLREEYSHKYTSAASVQGFKIQAPDYKDAIAAAVFAELLKNPAQSLDSDKKGGKALEVGRINGFLDSLITPRVEEALKKAGDLGKD
jgi:hypothetical protein